MSFPFVATLCMKNLWWMGRNQRR